MLNEDITKPYRKPRLPNNDKTNQIHNNQARWSGNGSRKTQRAEARAAYPAAQRARRYQQRRKPPHPNQWRTRHISPRTRQHRKNRAHGQPISDRLHTREHAHQHPVPHDDRRRRYQKTLAGTYPRNRTLLHLRREVQHDILRQRATHTTRKRGNTSSTRSSIQLLSTQPANAGKWNNQTAIKSQRPKSIAFSDSNDRSKPNSREHRVKKCGISNIINFNDPLLVRREPNAIAATRRRFAFVLTPY